MNQYEGMFLFDPTFGTSFESCETEIRRLMDRAQAELVFCRKWDERRLAYRIAGRKRGVYVLTYFKAPPDRVAGIERDAKLSEHILRLLVLRADDVTPEHMEKWVSAPKEESRPSSDDTADGRPERKKPERPESTGADEPKRETVTADVTAGEGGGADESKGAE